MGQLKPPLDGIEPGLRVGLTVLLSAIAAFGAVDLALDRPESLWSFHVLFEIGFVMLCLGTVAFLWRGWAGAKHGLARSQKEVALLLLKGLGHRQAAALMHRSERTVRQHAVAVYKKSGLSGRAELSAFFLEDLLLPHAQQRESEKAG